MSELLSVCLSFGILGYFYDVWTEEGLVQYAENYWSCGVICSLNLE